MTDRRVVSEVIRIDVAIALVVGGLVHLQLYFDGYRDIDKIGPSFLANVIGSVLVAAAVIWRGDLILVRLAAVGVAAGTLIAFALSRTDSGFLDFKESGFEPSPQTVIAMAAEIAVLVLVATSFLPALGWSARPAMGRVVASGSIAVLAIVTIGLGVVWANEDEETVASGPNAVTIEGFAFDPTPLTIAVGDTVTWTNADGPTHNVVEAGTFAADDMVTGDTFAHTYETAGTFAYICGIHPQMAGQIIVS